jgi:thiol-disulfide isomerase/thioredoxin
MDQSDDIVLETRQDLTDFIKTTDYQFVVLKFYANWCAPCTHISPKVHELMENKAKQFEAETKKFIFIEVNVDECFDLYAFLKSKKMVRGIPTMFVYDTNIARQGEEAHMFIPQASVAGTNMDEISRVVGLVK